MILDVLPDGSERIRYPDPRMPLYICMGDLRSFPGMAALCHWHNELELLMPVKGYLSYNVDGRILQLREGDAVLVNSRHMHYGFSTDGTDCEYICVCFPPELLGANQELYRRYVLPVLTNPGISHLCLDRDQEIHREILSLISGLWEQRDRPMIVMSQLYRLWDSVLRVISVGTSDGEERELLLLKQMLEFIRTHYPERVGLDQIAAAAGICRSKCCRIFRNYLRSTPNSYLISFRLEKAAELLRTTEQPISEIAYNCGFNSASYFSEQFSRWKGVTPRAFREHCLRE